MRAILTALGRLLRVRRQNKRNVEEMERQVLLLREKIRYLQVIAMRPGHLGSTAPKWTGRPCRSFIRRALPIRRAISWLPGCRCITRT